MPKIEFLKTPPAVLFKRETVFFGAYVDGKPVRCVVTFEALLGPGIPDDLYALAEFKEREAEIHQIAAAMIERGEVRYGEVLIDRRALARSGR